MEILLLGRNTTITNTIMTMLTTIKSWSVTQTSIIDSIGDETAVETSKEGFYDLIIANLADYSSPPTQITGKLTIHFPSSYLLVLYSYNREFLIKPLLEAGANGYLQNGISDDELLEAVQTVADGNKYIGVESTY